MLFQSHVLPVEAGTIEAVARENFSAESRNLQWMQGLSIESGWSSAGTRELGGGVIEGWGLREQKQREKKNYENEKDSIIVMVEVIAMDGDGISTDGSSGEGKGQVN